MQVNIDPRGTIEWGNRGRTSTRVRHLERPEVPGFEEHADDACFALTTFGPLR